jgi:hypothetical protein
MPSKISITLPSIYPVALQSVLASIRSTTRNPYEVIVVSPFRVDEPNVIWVEENERKGCAFAHDVAARHATGEFITAFADDWRYVDGWDEAILPEFLDREQKARGKYLMGLRYDHWNLVGTVFGIYYANFPFMRRSNIERYGWIGPEFKLGFGDADLSLRVWHRGGRCEFSTEKVLRITEEDGERKKTVAIFRPEDLATFTSRWVPVYGAGIKTAEIRDFNLDVCPELIDGCITERTIFGNSPKFVGELAKIAEISQRTPELVEGNDAINIVSFQGRFYTVPTSLGPINLTESEVQRRPEIRAHQSLDEARITAEEIGFFHTPVLVESLDTRNIVRYQDQFYSLPISLGHVNLTDAEGRKRPGIAVYSTIEEARVVC